MQAAHLQLYRTAAGALVAHAGASECLHIRVRPRMQVLQPCELLGGHVQVWYGVDTTVGIPPSGQSTPHMVHFMSMLTAFGCQLSMGVLLYALRRGPACSASVFFPK